MKKPVIWVSFFALLGFILINSASISAHGNESAHANELHAPVQIGLRENGGLALTRHEVADLVSQAQEIEEARSFIKFSLLLIFVFLVIWLFWPKKHVEINTQQRQ